VTESFIKLGNVLVIDDDEISNFIYSRVIEASGSAETTKSCMSGEQALQYLKDTIENNPDSFPDMIFLDINMPVMNGWEFLDIYIDEIPYKYQEQTILCMLSSSVYKEDINRAKQYSQVKEYIPKPLTSESLKSIMKKYFA